nr:hypothetical protein [Clostridia bacterium]
KLYNNTIDKTIPQALRAYDAKFAAHRLKYTLDYPLATKRSRLRGVYQIRSYIDSLIAENIFCREFESHELMRLYKVHCDRDVTGYDEANTNIFSLVFANAVIADYLKKEPGTLSLTPSDCETAEKLLGAFEEVQQREILEGTVERLCLGSSAHCMKALEVLMPGLLNAVKHRKLVNFLTVEK